MPGLENVLIVGRGIAALSAAIALRRHDIPVDVIDSSQVRRTPAVGTLLPGNGIGALAALGILDKCATLGFLSESICFQDTQGRCVDGPSATNVAPSPPPGALGISYQGLEDLLALTAVARGAAVHEGVTHSKIQFEDESTHVKFTNGQQRHYSLLLAADGLNSELRKRLFGHRPAPYGTGESLWECQVPRPAELIRPLLVAGHMGGMIGFVPLTHENANIILVVPDLTGVEPTPEQFTRILQGRLEECAGPVASLRARIDLRDQGASIARVNMRTRELRPAKIACQPIRSFFMASPWYRQGVLLIGEAAHAFPPHLAQSAAQALEDAVVLGELLRPGEPVSPVLEEFMIRRYERCKLIYECSIQLGAWEQDPRAWPDVLGLIQALNSRLGGIVAADSPHR